jgi:hypothetical protein
LIDELVETWIQYVGLTSCTEKRDSIYNQAVKARELARALNARIVGELVKLADCPKPSSSPSCRKRVKDMQRLLKNLADKLARLLGTIGLVIDRASKLDCENLTPPRFDPKGRPIPLPLDTDNKLSILKRIWGDTPRQLQELGDDIKEALIDAPLVYIDCCKYGNAPTALPRIPDPGSDGGSIFAPSPALPYNPIQVDTDIGRIRSFNLMNLVAARAATSDTAVPVDSTGSYVVLTAPGGTVAIMPANSKLPNLNGTDG